MSLINLQNLGVTLGAPLFSNFNLVVSAGERVGIVAANGRGKSTLLRAIVGEVEPTNGDITKARGLKIGYVRQNVPENWMDMPLYDVVLSALSEDEAMNESWRVDIVLDDLKVPDDMRRRVLSQLSGGWRRLALLAHVWVSEPDLLLLDEPTNHLDLGKIRLLEAWINALPRDTAVIVCSHDRAFLDNVTKRTLFLREEKSPVFALPYGRARLAVDEMDAADERKYQRDIKVAQQLRKQAAKLNNIGINSGSDLLVVKTKQLKERADRLEDTARPAHQERSAGTIRLASSGSHARALVSLDSLIVSTPDGKPLYKTGKMWICQGDRVVLLGANGVGKTRLLSLIRQVIVDPQAATAALKATPSLVLGYADQMLGDLDDSDTAMETVTRRFDIGDQRARSLLAGAGIVIDMQDKTVGHLSGGQKARLSMLLLRLTNPNFYILDEPTNHLDIEGQEALESELLDSQAACLLVSHDRSFIRNVGNRFWHIEKGRLIEIDSPEAFFAQADGSFG